MSIKPLQYRKQQEQEKMENIVKILFTIGAILLWFYTRIKRGEKTQRTEKQTSGNQESVKQPEDLLPQWEEELNEQEVEPAIDSLEETIESTPSPKIEMNQQEEKEAEEKKSQEEKQALITIAGMPFNPQNIKYGILFSEILERRGKRLKE